MVYAASSSAYGDTPTLPKHEAMRPDPISPYAVAKLASEHYMISFYRCYGLETVCLRYFNVFGPRQDPSSPYSGVLAKFITQMLRGEQPTIYGDGEQSRDFTYIDNVVEANLLACNAPAEKAAGQVFNVATGTQNHAERNLQSLQGLTSYSGQPNTKPSAAATSNTPSPTSQKPKPASATHPSRFRRRPAAHRGLVPKIGLRCPVKPRTASLKARITLVIYVPITPTARVERMTLSSMVVSRDWQEVSVLECILGGLHMDVAVENEPQRALARLAKSKIDALIVDCDLNGSSQFLRELQSVENAENRSAGHHGKPAVQSDSG